MKNNTFETCHRCGGCREATEIRHGSAGNEQDIRLFLQCGADPEFETTQLVPPHGDWHEVIALDVEARMIERRLGSFEPLQKRRRVKKFVAGKIGKHRSHLM